MDRVDHEEKDRAFKSKYDTTDPVLLGEGTYGKVYKARVFADNVAVPSGEFVALKQMKLDCSEEGIPSTAIREIAVLKELDHPNIVKLLDIYCKPSKLILVFEFVEQDLKKFMRARQHQLSGTSVKHLCYQLIRGVEFCHSRRIIHRDIKPQNLLIDMFPDSEPQDNKYRLKIADFGLARCYHLPIQKYTHEVVTVWYRPPEILLGCEKYSIQCDMWSIGCVFAEMATGAPLFAGDSEIDTIFKIFMKLGTPTEAMWPGVGKLPDFKMATFPKWPPKGWSQIRNTSRQVGPAGIALLEKLTTYDPKNRIGARAAITLPYFEDVDRNALEGANRNCA